MLLALLVGIFAFPVNVTAKCLDVPSDLVCAELRYSFLPASPVSGDEVVVIASWVDQRTAAPVTNVEWFARRGKPAYLWLWDHEPSELESIAYVEAVKGAQLPQIVVPLQWDAEKREYHGTFVLPKSGRWYFRLGTVVPDALSTKMEADFDYIGPIQSIAISTAAGSLFDNVSWSILPAIIFGSGLVIFALLWLSRLPHKYKSKHAAS